MALNASDVSGGDTALASQYNALIDDIEQHDHDGVDTTNLLGNIDAISIATGNEALIFDVVEMDLDGTSSDSVAYTLDGLKCKGLYVVGYDVNADDINFIPAPTTDNFFIIVSHTGANLVVSYGTSYVAGDDARILVFATA